MVREPVASASGLNSIDEKNTRWTKIRKAARNSLCSEFAKISIFEGISQREPRLQECCVAGSIETTSCNRKCSIAEAAGSSSIISPRKTASREGEPPCSFGEWSSKRKKGVVNPGA